MRISIPGTAKRLARLVLVWYVLFAGVSVLAFTLSPKTLEVVCSSMGVMKVVVSGDEGSPELRTSMDCPLCAQATPALPPSLASLGHMPNACRHSVQRLPAAVLLARTAPPLPSRGPPALI